MREHVPLLRFALAVSLLVLPIATSGCAERSRAPRPNVVVIVIDTLRADHLPFYGYPENTAPFLSKLARKGAVFERAYSSSSRTAPATASLFTSLHPEDHGVLQGRRATRRMREMDDPRIKLNRIPEEAYTLTELMQDSGYSTWGLSDNWNVADESGFAQGFDTFISNPKWDWEAEGITSRVREWKSRLQSETPYFLYIHYVDPHVPYHAQSPFYRAPTEPLSSRPGIADSGLMQLAEEVARYDSEIAYVDHEIEKLFQLLNWDRHTLLIVTSDHGEEFYEHGRSGHGKTLFNEVLRIPLLVHDSTGRVPPGRRSSPVSIIDIFPTLAEYLDIEPSFRMDGESFMPQLHDPLLEAGPDREFHGHLESRLYLRYDSKHIAEGAEREVYRIRSLIRGRWKLIQDSRGSTSLFSLDSDEGEEDDFRLVHPEVVREMTGIVRVHASRTPALVQEEFEETLTPETIERLHSLGYVD